MIRPLFYQSLVLGASLIGSLAAASGFEKSIFWGGQTSGVAGIGTPYIQGAQALYFNPAGLVSDKVGAQDIALNVSPTYVSYKAPLDTSGAQKDSESHPVYPFSLIYGNTVSDSWGFGVGGYVSSGLYADYQNGSFAGTKGSPEAKADLTVTEIAAGAGYKVNDKLKIGASWRVVQVKANLDILYSGGAGIVSQQQLHDLKDTEYTGFKLGAQYKLNEDWNLGLTYRSEVNFAAKGTKSSLTYTPGPQLSSAPSNTTVGTTLPAAITLGTVYKAGESWKIFGEYVWTQYSKVTNISVNTDGSAGSALILNFKDETNLRVAAEYAGWSWPVRFGYIWTSQVTDSNYQLPGLTPAGTGNTFTLGTGQAFSLGGQNIRADGGIEYTTVNGSGGAGPSATGGPKYTNGSNNLALYAFHLGATYTF